MKTQEILCHLSLKPTFETSIILFMIGDLKAVFSFNTYFRWGELLLEGHEAKKKLLFQGITCEILHLKVQLVVHNGTSVIIFTFLWNF